jgi:hypothetical protein
LSHTSPLFALVTFRMGSHVDAWAGLDCEPPISAPE